MKKLQKECSNSLAKYILFVLLLTVIANIITSISLPGLDRPFHRKLQQHNTVVVQYSDTDIAESVSFKQENRRNTSETDITNQFENIQQNGTGSMLTVYPFKGGLGNQMFQLASLVGISRNNNLTMFLCDANFLPNTIFNLPENLQRPCNLHGLDTYNNYAESAHGTYSDIHLDINKNWTLEGYFQSYKYFIHCEKDIREIFKIKEEFSQIARGFLREKVPVGTVTVGVHVRRGDFISQWEQRLGRVAPDRGYLTKAMKIFQRWYKNITFIVISDDQQWCKSNLQAPNIIFSPFRHAGSDLALVSQCDHMIMTVGTFGWWAGWLSAGTVIYYSDYPRAGSQIDKEFSKVDYYPDSWIPVHG